MNNEVALPLSLERKVDQVCSRFEAAWKAGVQPRIEDFVADLGDVEKPAVLPELILLDVHYRRQRGESCRAEDYRARFPEWAPDWPVSPASATLDGATAERPGTVIGPYKLLQQIGEGGMGTVYMAEQTEPVKRKVALKVIKPGMDSKQVIARFEAERQALAMMDHVNIARVFDAGATDAGRPYFVMELVRGVPITKYCDDNQLTPRQRLELFVPACQAIQHAHQKGIIHRDIKPSNVMITLYDGKPVPKVIDFGVAKATEQKLTERTLCTQYGAMIGTLEYMSPEQAEMSALGVDTRSDIYSLGVLLYELLTGSTPLSHKRVKEAAYAEILRMIKEEEPPKPSTRLSDPGEALASISALRKTEPAKLSKLMRGELDWIVMKTLEKDRNRRYETANGFAADVQRYLKDEPVQACPPTRWYRFSKFARRSKRALATLVLLGLVLVLAVVGLALSNWLIDRERTRTAAERDKARTANAQLKDNLRLALQSLDEVYRRLAQDRLGREPKQQKEDDEFLQKALVFYERFAEQNSDDPEVQLEMSRAYNHAGTIYSKLGQHARGIQAHERAVAIAEQLVVDQTDERKYRQHLGSMVGELCGAQDRANNLPEVDRLARRGLAVREKLVADFPDDLTCRRDLGASHNTVGWSLRRLRQPAAALQHYRIAADLLAHVIAAGLDTPRSRFKLGQILCNLGGALADLDDPAQVEYWRKSIGLYTDLVDNPNKDRGLPRDEQANVNQCRRVLAMSHFLLGQRLKTAADPTAEHHLTQSVSILTKQVTEMPNVPFYRAELAHSLLELGDLLVAVRRPADAEEPFRQAMVDMQRLVKWNPDDGAYRDRLALCHLYLGDLRSDAGRRDDAAEQYRQAFALIEALVRQWPKELKYLQGVAWNRATCLDPEFRDLERAVRVCKQLAEGIAPRDGDSWRSLGAAYYRAGDWKAAIGALERAMELTRGGANGAWLFLAMAHWKLGHADEARQCYGQALQLLPNQAALRRLQVEAAELLGVNEKKKD